MLTFSPSILLWRQYACRDNILVEFALFQNVQLESAYNFKRPFMNKVSFFIIRIYIWSIVYMRSMSAPMTNSPLDHCGHCWYIWWDSNYWVSGTLILLTLITMILGLWLLCIMIITEVGLHSSKLILTPITWTTFDPPMYYIRNLWGTQTQE